MERYGEHGQQIRNPIETRLREGTKRNEEVPDAHRITDYRSEAIERGSRRTKPNKALYIFWVDKRGEPRALSKRQFPRKTVSRTSPTDRFEVEMLFRANFFVNKSGRGQPCAARNNFFFDSRVRVEEGDLIAFLERKSKSFFKGCAISIRLMGVLKGTMKCSIYRKMIICCSFESLREKMKVDDQHV